MILAALIFIALGILVKHGRMHFLIAGYNTMSDKRKSEYDIEGVATVFRNTFIGMGVVMLSGYFAARWLEIPSLENICFFSALFFGLPYLLIVTNSRRFKRGS